MKHLAFLTFILAFPALALAATGDSSFVPLTTNAPFLEGVGNAARLPDFLNSIYRICIGAAAVLAVLQIMRAGIMYMGGDSVTEKKEARNLIAMSIGGLVLVLSPVVVFSVINPEILSLKIGGISGLASTCTPACTGESVCSGGKCLFPNSVGDGSCSKDCNGGTVCKSGSCVAPSAGTCPVIADKAKVSNVNDQNCCAAQSGCKVQLATGDAFADPICACTAPKPAAAATYGWRGAFTKQDGSGRATQQQGPFDTQAKCNASLGSWPAENNLYSTGEFSCNCLKPLSEQNNCTF
jgi:hypothetical protein